MQLRRLAVLLDGQDDPILRLQAVHGNQGEDMRRGLALLRIVRSLLETIKGLELWTLWGAKEETGPGKIRKGRVTFPRRPDD